MKTRTRLSISGLLCAVLLALSVATVTVFASGEGAVVTDYGTVPAANANNTFVLFDGEEHFLFGTDDWGAANATVRQFLDATPGKTVNVLVQKDYNVTAAVASDDWLGEMNGTVVFDLGEHTLKSNASTNGCAIFNAGARFSVR